MTRPAVALTFAVMAEVKICGINDAQALDAAIDGGARFVGFVVYPTSPRHLSRDKLASLAERARGHAETVVVTVDADDELLSMIAEIARPDWIQLHGRESPALTAHARTYARSGVTNRNVRTTPSHDDISIVCVSIAPRRRTAPSSNVPLVTPVAAKITSPVTRSSSP